MVTHLILVGYKCQSMFTRSVFFDADFISEPGLERMQPCGERFGSKVAGDVL
jgi:hypothetical protein